MEVIRFINDRRIAGDMPAMTVANDGMLQIIREIQMKAIHEENMSRDIQSISISHPSVEPTDSNRQNA